MINTANKNTKSNFLQIFLLLHYKKNLSVINTSTTTKIFFLITSLGLSDTSSLSSVSKPSGTLFCINRGMWRSESSTFPCSSHASFLRAASTIRSEFSFFVTTTVQSKSFISCKAFFNLITYRRFLCVVFWLYLGGWIVNYNKSIVLTWNNFIMFIITYDLTLLIIITYIIHFFF